MARGRHLRSVVQSLMPSGTGLYQSEIAMNLEIGSYEAKTKLAELEAGNDVEPPRAHI